MKILSILLCLALTACATKLVVPDSFRTQEVQTDTFRLAAWVKATDATKPYKIYIEGDGHAFNRYGYPTSDPTPRGTTLREIAFQDPSPNVIYLARPCQYVKDTFCAQRHWTTARFAPEAIQATHQALKKLTQDKPLILIGYSGGAQVAGLVATTKPDLKVKKLITLAGNLDHEAWTAQKNFLPLNESLSLTDYRALYLKFSQVHYVGEKDPVIPPEITENFIQNPALIHLVPNASHHKGFEGIYPLIWAEQ